MSGGTVVALASRIVVRASELNERVRSWERVVSGDALNSLQSFMWFNLRDGWDKR
jgi:hypothetical protein